MGEALLLGQGDLKISATLTHPIGKPAGQRTPTRLTVVTPNGERVAGWHGMGGERGGARPQHHHHNTPPPTSMCAGWRVEVEPATAGPMSATFDQAVPPTTYLSVRYKGPSDLAWTSFTQVNETATAPGESVSASKGE